MGAWIRPWARVFAAVGLMAALSGCDNIERPVSDPFLREQLPDDKMRRPGAPLKMTRDNLGAFYNFLVENRAITNQRIAELMNIREVDPERFQALSMQFKDQSHDLLRRVKIREEMIDLAREPYPDGHPAKVLALAAYFFREEVLHYQRVMIGREQLDPEFDRKTADTLDQAYEALERYTGE